MKTESGNLPVDYAELDQALLPDLKISDRVVEPMIRIRKSDGKFAACLVGRRVVRGEEYVLPALSRDHNWVLDNSLIRPLPADAPEQFTAAMSGFDSDDLSFADVIGLTTTMDSPLEFLVKDDVFTPAKAGAEALGGNVSVPGLHATLYPYQSKGVEWMLNTIRHTGGLILADEMGLGKTIQIIALLLLDRPSVQSPALIICPTSLIANWRNEIFRFGPELSVLVHRGSQRAGVSAGLQRSDIVITTYDTLVNDQTIFQGVHWRWLICDEAQAVKNPDSNRRQSIDLIPRDWTVPMTGTPVETSLLNLWSLTDLAIPGLLGTQFSFEKNYPDCEESARSLARLTDPVVLRRLVADVAGDLPDRIDVDVPLELGDQLADRYREVRRETLEKYPVAGALVATGQLQIFCAHPWLQSLSDDPDDQFAVIDRNSDLPLVTPKVERAISIVQEAFANSRKVLVFAIYNRCGELLKEACGVRTGTYWNAINGSTPQSQRQQIVDAFSAHDGPACLVLNPKAAGAGLNITAATVVIHFTQAWNPALELQASARAHRRGQTQPVTIYRLFYEDTVERVMIDRAEWRKELGNEAVPVSTRDEIDLERALQIEPASNNE